jgi:DNA-binding NtrC family response regulator
MEMLKNHEWVGNVRELENTLMNAVLLAKGNILEKDYFNFTRSNDRKNETKVLKTLAEAEKEHIQYVLEQVQWNKNQASKILGITKTTLYNKIALYGLSQPLNK